MKDFDPREHGIYPRFLRDDGTIVTVMWNAAVAAGTYLGSCRRCGFYMKGLPTHEDNKITWYCAQCTNPQCGKEIGTPNAQYLRRSSRRHEMPEGFWDKRPKKKAEH